MADQDGPPVANSGSAELDLKRRDLDLRELELRSKLANEKRNLMLTSPLLIAAVSAVFGLAGTGVGAALQGFWNTRLERQKFESGLIESALKTDDKEIAAKNLQFLVKAGLLETVDSQKILRLAENPDQLPLRTAATPIETSAKMSIREAKLALNALHLFAGRMDNETSDDFVATLKRFQVQQNIDENGRLGPRTVAALIGHVPEVPASSLQPGLGAVR